MNKDENINFEKSCPFNRRIIEKREKDILFVNEKLKNIDYEKCVYLNYRDKNTDYKSWKHHYETEENDICIYDNVVKRNILENIHKYIYRFDWNIQYSTPNKSHGLFFQSHVYDNDFFNKIFYDLIIPKIDCANKDKLKIMRSYINLNLPLHPGYWHKDAPGLGPTIILYLNPNWKTEWEGQTAFYKNTKTKEIKYVDVVPGRVVVFKPYIMHRACDISVYALRDIVDRFTLAFHTYYEQ